MASKAVIPDNHKLIAQTKVNKKYIALIPPAICAVLGRTFSEVSDDSILKSCIPPTCKRGKTEIAMTIMPIPPIHCNMDLQKSNPFDTFSKLTIIVDPVVVTPDIDSKKASVKLRLRSVSMKGKLPNTAMNNQVNVVMMNAWLMLIFNA